MRSLLRQGTQGFAEALEVDYLALAEELDGVVDVGIVGEAKDVVVGDARLLLCGEILLEIGDVVSLRGDRHRCEGLARGGAGIDAVAVADEVFIEASCLDLGRGEVARELIEDRRDHLCVAELLRADISENANYLAAWRSVSLVEIAHCRACLAVGAAEGVDDDACEAWVGVGYLYGVLQFFLIYPHNLSVSYSPRLLQSSVACVPGPLGVYPAPRIARNAGIGEGAEGLFIFIGEPFELVSCIGEIIKSRGAIGVGIEEERRLVHSEAYGADLIKHLFSIHDRRPP